MVYPKTLCSKYAFSFPVSSFSSRYTGILGEAFGCRTFHFCSLCASSYAGLSRVTVQLLEQHQEGGTDNSRNIEQVGKESDCRT